MAERCDLIKLCISFCNKISKSNIDIIVSLLRAKGRLATYEAIGLGMSTISMDMIAASCITCLVLSGAPGFNDDGAEMVSYCLHTV